MNKQERLIAGLRDTLKITEEQATDKELLELADGKLVKSLVLIEMAKQDFALAAKPALKPINDRLKKILDYFI